MQRTLHIAVMATALCGAVASAQSNIDPDDKFAWGENIGWTNWRDANDTDDGVEVEYTTTRGTNTVFIKAGTFGKNLRHW